MLARLVLGLKLVATVSVSAAYPTIAQQREQVAPAEMPVYVGKRCEGTLNSMGNLRNKALIQLNFPSAGHVHVLLDYTSATGGEYVDLGVKELQVLGDQYRFDFVVRGIAHRIKSTFDPAWASMSLDGESALGARLFGKIKC